MRDRPIPARSLGLVVHANSPIPVYFQVAQQIEAAITRGDLKVGEWLPAQDDLAAVTHLSLPTIRKAVDYLAQRGLVASNQGVGTVVIASHDPDEAPRAQGGSDA